MTTEDELIKDWKAGRLTVQGCPACDDPIPHSPPGGLARGLADEAAGRDLGDFTRYAEDGS